MVCGAALFIRERRRLTVLQDHCWCEVLLPLQSAKPPNARTEREWRADRSCANASTAQEEKREEAHVDGRGQRALSAHEIQDVEVES